MLVTFSALIVAAFVGVHSPSPSSRDSVRALHVARKAQGEFESVRRRLLPIEPLDNAGGCDDSFGQYCYRQQITAPPPQPPEIIAARARLLATLDSIGAVLPGDRWIAGQRVRYLIEAGRPFGADSVAIACAAHATIPATTSWCLALAGYTAQQLGAYERADAAFAAALDAMPVPQRCEWEDVGRLLGRSAAAAYRGSDCAAQDSLTAGFWLLVQPLYLRSVNDLRT